MSAAGSRPLVSERTISIVSPLILLALWEICARTGIVDVRFFPAPSNVIRHLVEMVGTGDLWRHLAASLYRLIVGFFVGCVPAIVIGLAIGLYRPVRAALDPLISATYPIPKSSLLPLILLIFGLGESSKIAMVAIGVFYPVVINTAAGVRQIAPIFLDVGHNFGASRFNMFRTVALPGALPLIMTGVKLGAGMGLVLIAIAEMVGAKSGLGYMIWNAWELFDVQTMYVGLFVIAIIGFLLNTGFDMLERVIVPWRKG
jgi:ABC-type nitrate/sulfonate/bicarbonate transport system permease component